MLIEFVVILAALRFQVLIKMRAYTSYFLTKSTWPSKREREREGERRERERVLGQRSDVHSIMKDLFLK